MSSTKELYETHLNEGLELTDVFRRAMSQKASIEDLFAAIKWELWEAIYNLPPMSAPMGELVNGLAPSKITSKITDAWHASASVSRAESLLHRLKLLVETLRERAKDPTEEETRTSLVRAWRALQNLASLAGEECAEEVAMGSATSAVSRLVGERDALRAEVERLRSFVKRANTTPSQAVGPIMEDFRAMPDDERMKLLADIADKERREHVEWALKKVYERATVKLLATESGKIGGYVISESFEGMSHLERQDTLWSKLKAELPNDVTDAIISILTMTPSEVEE